MKSWSLLRAVYLYGLCMVSYSCYASAICIEQIMSSDLSKERAVFIKCWESEYQKSSLLELEWVKTLQFLQELFDKEEQAYKMQAPNRLFFHAIQDNDVVGYVSFEIRNEHAIYLQQMALLPEFCSVDILQELIFVVLNYVGASSCIHMVLHELAGRYQTMSHEIGFVKAPLAASSGWIQMIMHLNKCGTCMCDLDYDENDDMGKESFPFYSGAQHLIKDDGSDDLEE